MDKSHPNIEVLMKFDPTNIDALSDVLAKDAVFHFFNPRLPDVEGDYVGLQGYKTFFETMAKRSNGTFKIHPVSLTPIGEELVITHVRDEMVLEGRQIELDAISVWRIVNGKIAEAWDIPAVNTIREISNESKPL